MMSDIALVLFYVLCLCMIIVINYKVLQSKTPIERLQELAKIAVEAAEQVGNYSKLDNAGKYEFAHNKLQELAKTLGLLKYLTPDNTKALIEAQVLQLKKEV